MKKHMFMAALGAGLVAGPAGAQFVFDKELIEVRVGPEVEEIKVEFPFTIGSKAVEIAEYDAPCSCLEARISDNGRLKWQPGEQGAVQGIFTIGNFTGTLDKSIVLRLKGENEPSVKLTVRMHIPVLLEIEPKTLFWNQGAAVEPQSFQMTVKGEDPLQIVDLSGTNDNFQFEMKTLEEGRRYEVVVTPQSLENRAFGLLRIKTDSKHKKHERYQGFMAIRKGG